MPGSRRPPVNRLPRPEQHCSARRSLPAPPRLPAVCCLSIFCGQCVSYHLRKRYLRGDMTRYLCCNGAGLPALLGARAAAPGVSPHGHSGCRMLEPGGLPALWTHASVSMPSALCRRLALFWPLRRVQLATAVPVPGGEFCGECCVLCACSQRLLASSCSAASGAHALPAPSRPLWPRVHSCAALLRCPPAAPHAHPAPLRGGRSSPLTLS